MITCPQCDEQFRGAACACGWKPEPLPASDKVAYAAIRRQFESEALSEFEAAEARKVLFSSAAQAVPATAPHRLRWAYELVERFKVGLPVPMTILSAAEQAIAQER